ncbi:MAG: hypothetical protein RL701_7724 [Pseudomonadota bacterium]
MTDGHDQICFADRQVNVVVFGQRGGAQKQVGIAVDRALAHLRVEERDTHATHERRQLGHEPAAVGGGADHDQRIASACDPIGGFAQTVVARQRRHDLVRRHGLDFGHSLRRDVFGQFEMHGAGPLGLGDAEGVAHQGGNHRDADNLLTQLGQRAHHAYDVDHLELRLRRAQHGLLPRDHEHGHAAQLRKSGTCREIRGAGTECGQAHARSTGQSTIRRRHECSGLLVSCDDEVDRRLPQRFENVEVFLTRHRENALNALGSQRSHK